MVDRCLRCAVALLCMLVTEASHAQSVTIKLPFPAGTQYTCQQGNDGKISHYGDERYAFDFAMPTGTTIAACAPGRVVEIKQDSTSGGPSRSYQAQANFVLIDHGNGVYSKYNHLQANSVLVSEGDLVRAGQNLGLSGSTGFTTAPHLHFMLCDCWGVSLPAKFAEVPGGVPVAGQHYTSQNDGAGVSTFAGDSSLPTDALAMNSIQLTGAAPANAFARSGQYVIRGRVTVAAKSVCFFIIPRSGGSSVAHVMAPVAADGSFTLNLRPADFTAKLGSGTFKYALAPVKTDNTFFSEKSLAFVLVLR